MLLSENKTNVIDYICNYGMWRCKFLCILAYICRALSEMSKTGTLVDFIPSTSDYHINLSAMCNLPCTAIIVSLFQANLCMFIAIKNVILIYLI